MQVLPFNSRRGFAASALAKLLPAAIDENNRLWAPKQEVGANLPSQAGGRTQGSPLQKIFIYGGGKKMTFNL